MRILIIGQNPAKDRELWPAFHNTKSGDRLFRWLEEAGLKNYDTANIWDKSGKLPSMKILRETAIHNIRWHLPFDKVITVGKVADKIFKYIAHSKYKILNIPHPSGLNRKLNDPNVEKQIIENIREFIK